MQCTFDDLPMTRLSFFFFSDTFALQHLLWCLPCVADSLPPSFSCFSQMWYLFFP